MKILNPLKKELPDIRSVKITKSAFEKMNFYAKVISEIVGQDVECMGTLMNHKEKYDNICKDVYLWKDQEITSGSGFTHCFHDAYEQASKKGMKISGIWHSHGKIPVFHSSDDKIFLENRFKETNHKFRIREKEVNFESIVDGEFIKLLDQRNNQEIKIKGFVKDIKAIKYDDCYILNSVVINKESYLSKRSEEEKAKKCDCEVWLGFDKENYQRKKNCYLKIVEETTKSNLNYKELITEVGEKVIFKGKYLKEFSNFKKIIKKYEQQNNLKKKENLEKKIQYQRQKAPNYGFYKKVSEFYTLNLPHKGVHGKIGLIGKILSGDYYEAGKRYWFWKDRIQKSLEIYKEIKDDLKVEDQSLLLELARIIDSHNYVKKKHKKKVQKLIRKFGWKGKNTKKEILFSKIIRRKKNEKKRNRYSK